MSRWVLYNSVKRGEGGSINEFSADSVEDLVKQVAAYEDPHDNFEYGWSAQNDDDLSLIHI